MAAAQAVLREARQGPRRAPAKARQQQQQQQQQPVAVARRNARERNRVKQVNDGFANLRQHIPGFVARAFDGAAGRSSKKLSKVETLRMAVEYIRSLEDALAIDGAGRVDYNSPNSTQTTSQFSFDDDDDVSLSAASPPPQQLIRINTADSTYEIISDDAENLDPLALAHLGHPVDVALRYDYLSPGVYSEESLSPGGAKAAAFAPTYANVGIKAEAAEHPVMSLKTETELPDGQKDLVDDVINWWETQPHYASAS